MNAITAFLCLKGFVREELYSLYTRLSQEKKQKVYVNSRTFHELLKDLPAVFKIMKNIDLHNEILLQE